MNSRLLICVATCAVLVLVTSACDRKNKVTSRAAQSRPPAIDLKTARSNFLTRLVHSSYQAAQALDPPPEGTYDLVRYRSTSGRLGAFLSPDPGDGKRHSAVVWAHGGFGGLDPFYWQHQAANNDQTPKAFLEAGFVVMLPSWRGENENPGRFELFYGEVDDLVAAVDYVRTLPWVDPEHVYLVGHSSGGTLVLLAAEAGANVRAAFSFGGDCNFEATLKEKDNPYATMLAFDASRPDEARLRTAANFVETLTIPTWYIEGSRVASSVQAARDMASAAKSAGAPFQAKFVPDGNHFDILRPLTRLLAAKLAADTGPACNVTLTDAEIASAYVAQRKAVPTPAAESFIRLKPAARAEFQRVLREENIDKGSKPFVRFWWGPEDRIYRYIETACDIDDLSTDADGITFVADPKTVKKLGVVEFDFVRRENSARLVVRKVP